MDALAPPIISDTSSGRNNSVNSRESESRPPTETPPKEDVFTSSDTSPKNVIDVAGQSFTHAGRGGGPPKLAIVDASSDKSDPPRRTSSRTKPSETATVDKDLSDTSGGQIMSLRVRARAVAKPERYREKANEEELEAVESPKPKKKASPASKKGGKIPDAPSPSWPGPGRGGEGSWTDDEINLFREGIVKHGWGNWREMEDVIVTRNRTQIKSHAQKFQKHHNDDKGMLEREHERIKKVGLLAKKKTKGAVSEKNNAKKGGSAKKRKTAAASSPETASMPTKRSKRVEIAKKKETPSPTAVKAPSQKTVAASPPTPPKAAANEAADETAATPPLPYKPRETAPSEALEPAAAAAPRKTARVTKCEPKIAPSAMPRSRRVKTSAWKEALREERDSTPGSGSWTDLEQLQFEKGCLLHGWGDWKAVERCIPTRNSAQVKSHAQKYRKHRPAEKERLDREHRLNRAKKKKKKGSSSSAKVGKGKKKKSAVKKRLLPLWKNREEATDKSGWSLTEKKQFEDGCIFHGFGNWEEVASHIHTKSIAQVRAHADKYHPKDQERLKMEHKLNYPEVAGEESEEEDTFLDAENTTVHHVLFGQKKQAVMQSPPPTPKATVDDFGAAEAIMALNFAKWDNRNKNANEKGEGPSLPSLGGLKEPSPATSSEEKDAASAVSNDGDVSADSHKLEDEAATTSEETNTKKEASTEMQTKFTDVVATTAAEDVHVSVDLEEDVTPAKEASSAMLTKENEAVAKTAEVANVSVDSHNSDEETMASSESLKEASAEMPMAVIEGAANTAASAVASKDLEQDLEHSEDNAVVDTTDTEKTMGVKSNVGDVFDRQDSKCSAPPTMSSKGNEDLNIPTATDSKDEAPIVKDAPSKPSTPKTSSQPPPHWLAAETWDDCMGNIYKWNNELTAAEKHAEYLKYDRLCGREKERLRTKLVVLMNNRPN